MSSELPLLKSDSNTRSIGLSNLRRWGVVLLLAAAFVAVCLPGITNTPTPWWDEGWTMMVARNWIEQGHYGRFLVGIPVSPGLSASFPTVASLALSFKLLGVGIGQARLPILLYTLASLGLLYFLTRRLYDRAAAIGALVIVLLLSPQRLLQPIFIGRQVWAEMPLLFFLLAGYVCFIYALQRRTVFMLLTGGFWAIALLTKAQVLPFWLMSIGSTVILALLLNQRRLFIPIVVVIAGSLLGYVLFPRLLQLILSGAVVGGEVVPGLYDVTAVVLDANVRLYSLSMAALLGLPLWLGLGYAAWQQFRQRAALKSSPELSFTRFALLILTSSWVVWYVALSNGWIRYLFPATFVGSMFVAAMLRDATQGFNLKGTLKNLGQGLRLRRFTRSDIAALCVTILVALMLPFSLVALYLSFLPGDGTSVLQAAAYVNERTAHDALIESYESELLFLLDRPYHFPPDKYHVDKMRSTLLNDNKPVEYDPLAVRPDYIVVGAYAQMWNIYDAALSTGQFQQVYADAQYQIYERVH